MPPAIRIALLFVATIVAWQPRVVSAESITLLSQNANRLFDNVNDGHKEKILSKPQFDHKIHRLAKRIGLTFQIPEVIALQEIENRNVLRQLADRLASRFGIRYQSVLIPGQDVSGINVGYLVHSDWRVDNIRQLLRAETLASSDTPLYSRPPLLLRVCKQACLTIVNLHLRSMRGLNAREKGQWVANKRLHQANHLARWIDRFQDKHPAEPLILLGDFNALTPADRHVDVRGILLGKADNPQTRLRERDLIKRDLIDLTQKVPKKRRYSYLFKGNQQQLDYLLASQRPRLTVKDIRFSRIDYRLSDHAALFTQLNW